MDKKTFLGFVKSKKTFEIDLQGSVEPKQFSVEKTDEGTLYIYNNSFWGAEVVNIEKITTSGLKCYKTDIFGVVRKIKVPFSSIKEI